MIDSKQLFNAARHLHSTIVYNEDWVHFGTGDQIKLDMIERLIDDHLTSNEILFIQERTNSAQFKKHEIVGRIKPILGKENFQLWMLSMDKMIQFNAIGVLRLGCKKTLPAGL
ncbi:hypothetical protein SAMN04488109_4755 [Chryseolinea serpens]|uniref:Uncharacterized protein n=1 Tax=Chryseolinea serpens TaxID=947013 RepID=A0A1M5UKT6_9BACT|nr:hypothetical protein [Chryseolinea serpens]SHH63672.1 hypothetical protein SAMN04488109_4755 [Chryseolinea serpens]